MIKKRNEPKNLARLLKRRGIIVDKTPTSSDYFNITFLPRELVAGKNVIKIQGTQNLVKTSEIQFEVLDSNGTPIFYEVLNYLAADGSRVIVLYIYPETAPGRATLYLASRAEINAETGRQLPVSNDPTSTDYIKEPNVLWTNNIIVNPTKENTGEIIYLAAPKVTIKESIQTFKVPNTAAVPLKVTVSSSINNRISSVSSNLLPPASTGLITSVGYTPPTTLNVVKEGQFKPNIPGAASITLTADTELDISRTTGTSGDIIRLDNKELLSKVSTRTAFFKSDMQGGTLAVTVDTSSLLPKTGVTALGQLIDGTYVLSNKYNTTIVDVINDTTAVVSEPFRYYYQTDAKSQVGTNRQTVQAVIGFTNASSFTSSYIQRVTTVTETESSQSYADIYISNLEPAAGDVYKIQTFYKPYGALGNFTDAGFTLVENTSIMNDSGSLVSDALLGQKEQPKGDFTSQTVINTYWELTNVNITGTTLPAITASADKLIDGMTITTGSGIVVRDVDANNVNASATFVTLKNNLNVVSNTEYKLIFKTVGVNSSTYKTSQYPNATIDIYISGSVGIEAAPEETITDRRLNARSKKFLGNKNLGTYLGSFDSSGAYLENAYQFRALSDGTVKPLFVVRSGQWTISDVDIIAEKQSGFTPNYTNFKVRIPAVYINTEMIFNFKYFDSANNPAPIESNVVGVIFKGNNVYLAGTNNLLTGSVYIGNSIGSGIEMAGVSSGYVKSVGYQGFTSASLGKGPGGFLMWSGSNKLNVGVDNYQGVGLELVAANDDAHLIFDTFKSTFDVKAKSFFVGDTGSQFISGSNGKIEISSSNFHLTPNGDLIAQGIINANSGYFKNINVIGQPITITAGKTNNDFAFTGSVANTIKYSTNFISIGVTPDGTGSNTTNLLLETTTLYKSASISNTLLSDVYEDYILSSSYARYDTFAAPTIPPYAGNVTYYPNPGSGPLYALRSALAPGANGNVTASIVKVPGLPGNLYNAFQVPELDWQLIWSNDETQNILFGSTNNVANQDPSKNVINWLLTGSSYTISPGQEIHRPVNKSAFIYARSVIPSSFDFVPFFYSADGTRVASSSILGINYAPGSIPGAGTFGITCSLQYDKVEFESQPNIFLELRSLITGSEYTHTPIIGKRLETGNVKWTIGGPLYTSSLASGSFSSSLMYYKDYRNIPDYNAALEEFVRWNEKTNTFEDYSFTSSFTINTTNITPFSGFLFLSASNAVVSSSQFAISSSGTASADSVVFYNRKEYTPSNYGLTFTGTNFGKTTYGTQILNTTSNTVNAYGTINSVDYVTSSVWDYLESDIIDISNYVLSSSLIAEAIKLQFAMRWVDNFSDNTSITASAQDPVSGSILPSSLYSRYEGFRSGLQTYIRVTFYDAEYNDDLTVHLPIIGTKTVTSDSNGSTNKWYVGDFFINPYIQRTNGTIPRRIKIRISWNAHPSSLLQQASFQTGPSFVSGYGDYFVTGYPVLGRYNGVAISEIRLMQAAKAEVVDFTEIKIGGTSLSTVVTASTDFQELNAAGLIPGDYRLAEDGTYNITLGQSWRPWTSLYVENIYRTNEYSLSDKNQKLNIRPSNLGLSFINQLTPVSYNWVSKYDKTRHYGLIAQDVKQVLDDNNMKDIFLTTDGLGLSYVELIGPMIKAIQELTEKVTRLELQISSSKQ